MGFSPPSSLTGSLTGSRTDPPPEAPAPDRRPQPQLVNVHEAKTQLSRLLLQVEQGEEIWIARAGRPVARLSAWEPSPSAAMPPGAMRGAIHIAADFDAPAPQPGPLQAPR